MTGLDHWNHFGSLGNAVDPDDRIRVSGASPSHPGTALFDIM